MSKPHIEFKLAWWDITYQSEPFRHFDDKPQHYEARMKYVARSGDKSINHDDIEDFSTFEEAKAWIDKELES